MKNNKKKKSKRKRQVQIAQKRGERAARERAKKKKTARNDAYNHRGICIPGPGASLPPRSIHIPFFWTVIIFAFLAVPACQSAPPPPPAPPLIEAEAIYSPEDIPVPVWENWDYTPADGGIYVSRDELIKLVQNIRGTRDYIKLLTDLNKYYYAILTGEDVENE